MSKKILVVDDDDDVRRLAVMSLSRVGGHDVRAAESGAACLAALTEDLPDAIVLDVMMPGMDGPATLAEIRADANAFAIPVIFLTAGVVESDVDRLRSLPVAGVLRKPFDPLTLPTQVADLLGWQDTSA
jgi:CheY-like chemotaxis protein